MKYYVFLAVLLTGCSTLLPVSRTWPAAPKEMFVPCPALKQLSEDTNKLSVVVDNVVENYSTYHECQAKHEAWIKWHKEQKTIYEEIE